MQTVHLNGNIAKFGEVWHTDCSNIGDIFKLINCQEPSFRKYLIDSADAGVGYEIVRGGEVLDYPEEMLLSLNNEDIIITEVPAGSKSAGAKILAAIIITWLTWGAGAGAGGFGTTVGNTGQISGMVHGVGVTGLNIGGQMAMGVAINLALQGIAQLMMPGPEVDAGTDESYLFDGPKNSIQQGFPVPVAYGELIVGGSPISQRYTAGRTAGSAAIEIINKGIQWDSSYILYNDWIRAAQYTDNNKYFEFDS